MKPYQITDRLSLLYGEKYPLVQELERAVNTEELSSIFTLAQFMLGRKHSETVRAFMNLVYERTADENVFVLFKVIKETSQNDEALHALRNICSSTNDFVNLQTELLLKLIINLEDRSEDVLDALKNIVAVETEPDLFLLFKVLQAIDPECEDIGLLKSNTLMKTKMYESIDLITGERFTIPTNMKKMIRNYESESLTDAFSRGQLRSKIWLIDILNALELDIGNMVYVCAGWYGILPALLFERANNFSGKIRSFDMDPTCAKIAETMNKSEVLDSWRFKASTLDVRELTFDNDSYTTYKVNGDAETINDTTPSCIINTSCEHIEDFDAWFNSIPKGTLVIMQNNNFVEHDDETVVNTIVDEDAWSDKLNLSNVIFKGTLNLEKYDRYMVIGRK